MKVTTKIVIFMWALVIMIMPAACAEPTPTPAPAPMPPAPEKITLANGPIILDMSSELPSRFKRLDAASEGFSNEDLGLGPDFSEVELFLSEEPYQLIFGYLVIIESRVEQAASNAIFKDEEQIRSVLLEGLREGAAEEGIELSNVNIQITYPIIADLAVLGSGTMSAYGVNVGYDLLMFKSNKVYVFIASNYLAGESVSLAPLANGIEKRIGIFSQ